MGAFLRDAIACCEKFDTGWFAAVVSLAAACLVSFL